jgi:hypothetical protein
MTSANQCELTRAYVQYDAAVTPPIVYSGVSEESIVYTEPFDIVLELEAGWAIWSSGAKYNLYVVLNDLSDSSTTLWTTNTNGSLDSADPSWLNPAFKSVFQVPAGTITAAQADHVLQAIGVMSVGVGNPIVDLKQSELFIITQP